jgi:hypothetical protein
MKTSILRNGERYFGVDIEPDGALAVFERSHGRSQAPARYPAGRPGAEALRRHISGAADHPHVCIRACGAAALTLMSALTPVRIELTTVSPRAIEKSVTSAEQRAESLARLAERLF